MNYNRLDRERSTGNFNRPQINRQTINTAPAARPVLKVPPVREMSSKSEMQIILGKHQGRDLLASDSPFLNTAERRVREALFSTLYRKVKFSRFLDLYSGCGAVGLEAISREGMLSTFVERSARMCTLIRKNMDALEIKPGHGEVIEMEVLPYLQKMVKRGRTWNIAFSNPPFDDDSDAVLKLFARGRLLQKERGVLVIAHGHEKRVSDKLGVLRRFRTVKVQDTDTTLSFYENRKLTVK